MMVNSCSPLRDEAAISHFDRAEQEDGSVCYFFGDTTIRVIEARAERSIRLIPVSGDQIACGEWVELDEEQVRRYCDLLSRHLNNGASAHNEASAEGVKVSQKER